jgi:fatty acid desaturase
MKLTLKACRLAVLTAIINGALALALMLLVEFSLSGSLAMTRPFLIAGLLIALVIFVAQFFRQLRLFRCHEKENGAH